MKESKKQAPSKRNESQDIRCLMYMSPLISKPRKDKSTKNGTHIIGWLNIEVRKENVYSGHTRCLGDNKNTHKFSSAKDLMILQIY